MTEITLRDRGVLEELQRSGYATEVGNYLERAAEVRALELGSSLSVPVAAGPDVRQVRQARQALDEATAVIRGLPGMRDFHHRLSLAELQELARAEPLVYLSSSPAGGCASVVKDHTVTSVEMPGLQEMPVGNGQAMDQRGSRFSRDSGPRLRATRQAPPAVAAASSHVGADGRAR